MNLARLRQRHDLALRAEDRLNFLGRLFGGHVPNREQHANELVLAPLVEILEPGRAEATPVRVGAPTEFWPAGAETTFSDSAMTSADEDVIRGRLRALGYFE